VKGQGQPPQVRTFINAKREAVKAAESSSVRKQDVRVLCPNFKHPCRQARVSSAVEAEMYLHNTPLEKRRAQQCNKPGCAVHAHEVTVPGARTVALPMGIHHA
jgi:hypothetical protein